MTLVAPDPARPGATERSIYEQFPFWAAAPRLRRSLDPARPQVLVGCGSSYHLAQSVAAALNTSGVPAQAVPAGEWSRRPHSALPPGSRPHVLALSRSGETTETVQAAERSQAQGLGVTALTCAPGSRLTRHADRVLCAPTHPEEGIVMTASASLLLLLGLGLAGFTLTCEHLASAQGLLHRARPVFEAALAGRSHFVFLGGGELHGVAQEGALKLQEMSLSYTQAYHPLEYRHGPVSLVDGRTLAVLLYHPDTTREEAVLAAELRAKGAYVLGFGGPGDVSFALSADPWARALTVLPALQLLGECVARTRGLDSGAPRHLSRVVTLA